MELDHFHKYEPYQYYSESFLVKGKKKFVMSILKKQLLIRFEYIYIGSFSNEKNVWMWSDNSEVLDKKMIPIVSSVRSKLLDQINSANKIDEIMSFAKNDYSVYSTPTLNNILKKISLLLEKQIVSLSLRKVGNMNDYFIVEKIISNNMS